MFVQIFLAYDRNKFVAYITNINQTFDNIAAISLFILYNALMIQTILYRDKHLKLLNQFNLINEFNSNIIITHRKMIKKQIKYFNIQTKTYAIAFIAYVLIYSFGFYFWSIDHGISSFVCGLLFSIQTGAFITAFAYIRYLAIILHQFIIDIKNEYILLLLINKCEDDEKDYQKLVNLTNFLDKVLTLNENFAHVFGWILLINSILDFVILSNLGFILVITIRFVVVDDFWFKMKIFYNLLYMVPSLLKNIFIVHIFENIGKEVKKHFILFNKIG